MTTPPTAQIEERSGLVQVLQLSWPASLTMLNTTIIRFVDGWMVSRVGPQAFTAQMIGGISAFITEAFMVGVLLVVNTFVSQNFGARRYHRTSPYAWGGIVLALAYAVCVSPLALAAGPIFRSIGHVEAELEILYFRFMVLSICLTLTIQVLSQFFFGIQRPRIVLFASLVGNGLNVLANYALIFGHFGLPRLELMGAAIGSIFAWGVEAVLLLAVFLSPGLHARYGTREPLRVRWRHCRDLLRIGWPAGLQISSDVFSWNLGIVLLAGTFGLAHRTVTVIAMRYMGLSFMPAIGIGMATTALVGRYIGERRPETARRRAHTALKIAMVYMGACGLVFWLFRYELVGFFVSLSPGAELSARELIGIGGRILLFAAAFQLFDAVGIVYIGALRGAGDTRWPMLVTIVLSWTFVIGGGSAAVFLLPGLTSAGPWMAATVYVVLLGMLMAWRFESGAWRRIELLEDRGPEPPPTLGPGPTPVIAPAATHEPGGPEETITG